MGKKLWLHIRQYWGIYLTLVCVYGVGVIFGAVGSGALGSSESAQLHSFIDSLLANQPAGLDSQFLLKLARDSFIIMGGIWLLGLTVIGLPVVYLIVFTRGFVLGFTVSFMVQAKGLAGIGLAFISMIFPALLNIPLLLLGAGMAVIFSFLLLRGKTLGGALRREFFQYTAVAFLVSLGAVVSGVAQGYFSLLGVHLLGL